MFFLTSTSTFSCFLIESLVKGNDKSHVSTLDLCSCHIILFPQCRSLVTFSDRSRNVYNVCNHHNIILRLRLNQGLNVKVKRLSDGRRVRPKNGIIKEGY
jgi:hypothetical protein